MYSVYNNTKMSVTTVELQNYHQCNNGRVFNYRIGELINCEDDDDNNQFAFQTRVNDRQFVDRIVQKLIDFDFKLKCSHQFNEYRYQNNVIYVNCDGNINAHSVGTFNRDTVTVIKSPYLTKDILCYEQPKLGQIRYHEIEIPFDFASEEHVEQFTYTAPTLEDNRSDYSVVLEKRSEPNKTKYYEIKLVTTSQQQPHMILQMLFGIPCNLRVWSS